MNFIYSRKPGFELVEEYAKNIQKPMIKITPKNEDVYKHSRSKADLLLQ